MPTDRTLAEAVFELGRVNPFVPERRHWEQVALGPRFVQGPEPWGAGDIDALTANVERTAQVAEELVARMGPQLRQGPISDADRIFYGGVVFMALYHRHSTAIPDVPASGEPASASAEYGRYLRDFHTLFAGIDPPDPQTDTPAHLYACFWQIRRAYDAIFSTLSGGSIPAAALRAAVWQSIFSHDAVRYRRYLFRAMPDIPTLITGPTGTGKELVARAIGLSGYILFDEARGRFAHAPTFLALNLQAMPAPLIESELFGHRKGSFTGATSDREGWLSRCPRGGTVFLDEIGDLDPILQVKLLRVLEDRTFSPVGDTRIQRFAGKIVAATHRDLPAGIAAGHFRQDLYWRLCGDRVETPSLRARLDADGRELREILRNLVARWVEGPQVESVTEEVHREILRGRGSAWPWPGNVRELAQCARNVLVQGSCGPPEGSPGASSDTLGALAERGLSLSEVQQRYVAAVWRRTGSYKAAAEVLGIDWRTVKAHVRPEPDP